jgi:hypothetical protein
MRIGSPGFDLYGSGGLAPILTISGDATATVFDYCKSCAAFATPFGKRRSETMRGSASKPKIDP